jgi:1-acyl-sn-glycerol-3-phosphate acyltransferase
MRMPGLLPFKMGAFEIGAITDRPIIPIAIRGTRSILRAGSWFPRHGIITITFGAPTTSHGDQSQEEHDTWATALQLRDKSRKWILAHCGEPDLSHERPRLQSSGPTLQN